MFEKELENSGLTYTIFQCGPFLQIVGPELVGTFRGLICKETTWVADTLLAQPYVDLVDAAKKTIKTLSISKYENQKNISHRV
jgi:hypothetical protein